MHPASRLVCATTLLSAVAGVLSGSPAGAEPFPVKPVRILTSNSPGGTSDIFVRALGDEHGKRWGHPAIIENRSGGGMIIAVGACAEAPNDGYTICILPNETL